jgi:hypothetical protein
MLPRHRLPPSKSLIIKRLQLPIHRPVALHFYKHAPQILQTSSTPAAGDKSADAIIQRVLDAFDHSWTGLSLWCVIAEYNDIGEDVTGAERGDVIVWLEGADKVLVCCGWDFVD